MWPGSSISQSASLALAALAAGEPALRWKGRMIALEKLPAELPAEVGRAAEPFGAWADRKGYRLELSASADCILIVPKSQGDVDGEMELIAATLRRVGEFLPPRPGEKEAAAASGAAGAGSAGAGQPTTTPYRPERLEDFELPSTRPDVSVPRVPHQVPVLIKARNQADNNSALDALAAQNPWLAGWVEDVGKVAYGLVLPRPLIGAWLVNAPANEEWDPLNELVNRLAQLCVLDRGGQPPYWLLAGLAWNVELDVRGTIYCFPYRDEFVGIGEHAGWSAFLKTYYSERGRGTPALSEIAALKRGRYVDPAAGHAWGTVRWILSQHKERLLPILLELDERLRKDGIDVRADGIWTTLKHWEVPEPVQLEILKRHLGPDFLDRLGQAFREGV